MDIRAVSSRRILAATQLLKAYAEECSLPEIGQVNPQGEMYERMEDVGVVRFLAAIEDEQLIGFASVLMTVLPHYGRKVATMESLFVASEYRASEAGRKLMNAVEEYAKANGCVAILYSAPAGGQLERLLSAKRSYRHSNTVFAKSL